MNLETALCLTWSEASKTGFVTMRLRTHKNGFIMARQKLMLHQYNLKLIVVLSQGIELVPEEEFTEFLTSLLSPLPLSFRICRQNRVSNNFLEGKKNTVR